MADYNVNLIITSIPKEKNRHQLPHVTRFYGRESTVTMASNVIKDLC